MTKSQPETRFETLMEELEQMVASLESQELGLDEAIERSEQALALIQTCRQRLEGARGRIDKLLETPNGDLQRETWE